MPVELNPTELFVSKLAGVKQVSNKEWIGFCPVHEADGGNHDPSLHVTMRADGSPLIHCFVCGKEANPTIVHTVGLTMRDLFGNLKDKSPKGRKIADYVYRDESGVILYRAERWEKSDGSKTFIQSRPNGEGGWKKGTKGVRRVLYNLPELIAAPIGSTIFVVEGEKKVEALRKWGLIATCNVGGAGKWNKEYSKYLKGHHVVILPDNDPVNPETGSRTGFDHAIRIIETTKDFAASIRIIELPELPPKGDIVNWQNAGHTLPELLKLLEAPWDESQAATIEREKNKSVIQEMDPLDLRISQSRSDVGNAKRFTRNHSGNLKYCHPWKKWLVWDGKRWIADQMGYVIRNAKSVSASMWNEMKDYGQDVSEGVLESVMQFAKASASDRSIRNMVHLAESEEGHQFMPEDLDADPWLLNCDNGTIDLRTGELREHNRNDLLTKISPTKFDIDAKCPAWDKFLKDVFISDELVGYVRRLCGYWATGIIREQILPVLWGNGSNGKTTFLNAITQTIGADFCMKAPADFIMAKRTDSHPTDKADLFGKRLVVCSETDDGKRLAESMVKELTGDEAIRARRMREDFWEFNPTHKILLVTNHKPMIRGTDHGIWRRIRLIPFVQQFWNPDKGETGPAELMQDATLKDRLAEEMPGILTWIVRGCIEWYQNGERTPQEVEDQTREYRSNQDILRTFIEERCTEGIQEFIKVGDLYAAFAKWARESNEFAPTKTKFGILMSERGYQRCPSERFYMGIGLREEGEY